MACDRAPVPDTYGVRSAAALDLQKVNKNTVENGSKSYGRNQTPEPESEFQLAAKIWNAESGFWLDIEPDSQYSEFCETVAVISLFHDIAHLK
jgi:hypothetical protein